MFKYFTKKYIGSKLKIYFVHYCRKIQKIMNKRNGKKYPLYHDNDSAEFFGDMMNGLSDFVKEEQNDINYVKNFFETQTRITNVCRRYVTH